MAGFSGAVANTAAVQSLQAVVVWEPGAAENPLRTIGGLTLLERILRQLSDLDAVKSIVVLKSAAVSLPPASGRVRKPLECYNVSGAKFWEILREARGKLAGDFIAVAADFLIDQRLFAWLAMQTEDVMLTSSCEGGSAEPAARLTRKTLDVATPQSVNLKRVAVSSLPSYWEAMHGDVPLHLYQVSDEASAKAGWKILLDYVQKRTLELPAQYFDPTFENFLIRRLAGTSVTANQVTLMTGLLGFVVAALYYAGWLRVGVLVAIFVEVLDGVDGKLARITRTTSRAGEFEHVLDFFYENSWYLALGLHLSHGSPHALKAALLMILFDLADNVAYSLMDVRLGLSLDNASPFLARFRLIAGRRNIYSWVFLVGFFLGFPSYAFFLAVVWAGITAAIHGGWVLSRALSRPILTSD